MRNSKIKYNNYDVLVSPVLTEKSLSDETGSIHVFKVRDNVTKKQIKVAVEDIFNVSAPHGNSNSNFKSSKGIEA